MVNAVVMMTTMVLYSSLYAVCIIIHIFITNILLYIFKVFNARIFTLVVIPCCFLSHILMHS